MSTAANYHPGEIAAHDLAGLASQAEHSRAAIGGAFPAASVDFLAAQPMLVLAAADDGGRTWVTPLSGAPGFVKVTSGRTLEVASRPAHGDPLQRALQRPAQVGILALEPESRRRMRVNGRAVPTNNGISVTADQVYANCPKYISKRSPQPLDPARVGGDARVSTSLDPAQQRLVAAADTFFVGTRSARGDADASHRGGNPGFVLVHDAATLSWPDYVGNAMMMTLGNLLEEPSAGLLFVDWTTGGALQVTGRARIDWDPGLDAPPGAQRMVHLAVDRVVQRDVVVPLQWSRSSLSRFNPPVSAP